MRSAAPPPVLLVHGIWDDGSRFDRMRAALEANGRRTLPIDLRPNDGSAPIESLGAQVGRAASELLTRSDETHLDVVGFSMGALVARYWLQRLDGKSRCRRFVSISGPHRGTAQAFWIPFLEGVRQMQPRSALLADLESDPDPFGDVEVHTVWTPYDLMILPSSSSRLAGAAGEHPLPIALHRSMIQHPRAIARVREILER